MWPAANRSVPRAGRAFRSKTPKMVPKMLLLFTFEEPSSGSRTTEKRPRPTSFTWPISSDATCASSFESRSAYTNRSFIQMSSSRCCSPYTLRVVAGSRRTGNSLRIRGARPRTRSRRRPRSGSNFPAWWAIETAGARRLPLLDVPSLEVVLEFFLPSVEVPPGSGKPVGEVREDLEILHALGPDGGELPVERLLPERVLPDRAAREETGGAALARDLHESPEHFEVRARAEHDPRHLRRPAQAIAVLAQLLDVRRDFRVAGEFGLQDIESEGAQDLGGPDDRVGLVVRERLLGLVHGVRHRFAHEREVDASALLGHVPDDLHLVVDDLARRVRIEEDQEFRRAGAEPFDFLHAPSVEEGREPPVPLLLVARRLQGNEEARAAREDEPVDRRAHPELRVEEVAARDGREGLCDADLDRLHLRVGGGLRVLRMKHLLEAPPLVHRDHREAARVVRDLLEPAELANRNPHPRHLRIANVGGLLTFAPRTQTKDRGAAMFPSQ